MSLPSPFGYNEAISVRADSIVVGPSPLNGNVNSVLGDVTTSLRYDAIESVEQPEASDDTMELPSVMYVDGGAIDFLLDSLPAGEVEIDDHQPQRNNSGELRLSPEWAAVGSIALALEARRPTIGSDKELAERYKAAASQLATATLPFFAERAPVLVGQLLAVVAGEMPDSTQPAA